MKQLICCTFIFLAACLTHSQAQHALGLYHLQNVPQQSYVNPSFSPQGKMHVGIPALTNIHFGYANGGFAYADVIKKRSDDSLYLDVDYLIDNWKDNSVIQTKFHFDILNIGFRLKRNYFTINATEKVEFDLTIPRDLIDLAWNGNAQFIGKPANIGINTNMMHYREYGFTWSRELSSKLRGGIKLKYLYGMENVYTEKSKVSIYTDEDDYSLSANASVLIHTSGLNDDSFENLNIIEYLTGKGNTGFGADIGFSYKHNSKWLFNLSAVDLGYISWKSDNSSYTTDEQNANWSFSGIDLNEYINGDKSLDDLVGDLVDSLENSLTIDTLEQTYNTTLNPKLYIGANYQLNQMFGLNALAQIEQVGYHYKPAGSLALTAKVSNVVTASAAWSYFNNQYNNVGAGVSLHIGPVQWHLTSDNLLAVIKPTEAHSASIRTGLNIIIGRPKKDRDFDGVANKLDKCPKDYGLVEFDGCPDSDDDGIQDSEDVCPDIAGVAQYHGCPVPENTEAKN